MQREYQELENDYIAVGDTFLKNGLNYPASEVNYEQAIVAPSVMFLLQLIWKPEGRNIWMGQRFKCLYWKLSMANNPVIIE